MRKAPLLLLLPLILQCTSYNRATPGPPNPCDASGGVGHNSPNALVCINAGITTANPNEVHVKGNANVDFYIVGGVGELEIQLPPTAPVNQVRCDGAHCSAHAKAVTSPTAPQKYTVIERVSGKWFDPTVIIEP
jgi:hypothetical protein